MCLVHIESVHPQLLEGDDIILPFLGFQFGEPLFQLFAGAFQLLDGKLFAALVLEFFDTMRNVIQLLPEKALLPLLRDGNPLKLAVSDNHRVIIARRKRAQNFCRLARSKSFFVATRMLAEG